LSPVPAQCQAQDEAVAALKTQFNALVDQANSLSGDAVWPVLAQLRDLSRQLDAAKLDLAHCIDTYNNPGGTSDFAPIPVTVHVISAAAGLPTGPQEATVWALTDSGPQNVLAAPVDNGEFVVNQVFPPRTAISVATTGVVQLRGPDFRSGVLEDLTGNPLRIEIVLGPVIRISQEELNTVLATLLPIAAPPMNESMVQANGTITTLAVGLEPGVATITASGSLSGSAYGIPLGDLGFSGSVGLAVTPSVAPDAQDLVEVTTATPVAVEFSGSLIAAVANSLSGLFGPFVENLGMTQLLTRLTQWLPGAISQSLLLAGLPKDCTLSVRDVSIEHGAISAQPVLGCVGNALSTFDPPAIPYE